MNYNDKPKIFELSNRIAFLELSSTTDVDGFKTETWTEQFKAWAAVRRLVGREYWAAFAEQHENDLVFTIRYNPAINNAMRARYKGDDYVIYQVDNEKFPKQYTLFRASTTKQKVGGMR